jgi:glucose/mannose transport system permease protein
MAESPLGVDFRTRLQEWIPKLVLSPSLAAMLVFVYGFIAYTIYLSFTDSKMLPSLDLVGFENYAKLWNLSAWWVAVVNLMIFVSLYITICTAIGLTLAILLDQKIRGECVLRPIYLYPMALSFIVTGTAWKWIMDPGSGSRTRCTFGAGPAFTSIGSRTATWRSIPWSSPPSGRHPAL